MSSNPSPAVAALLSFVFPGAGQVYAGETRKGLIWAIPMVIFVLAVIWILLGGQNRALGLLRYETLLAILVLNVAFFFYHVAAMLDAYAVAQRERARGYGYAGGAPILLAALVSFALILHGVPEVLGYQMTTSFCHIVRCTNDPNGDGGVIPRASFDPIGTNPPQTAAPSPTTSLPTSTPQASGTQRTGGSSPPQTSQPSRTPLPALDPPLAQWPEWAQDDRLNILVVGTDSRSDTGVEEDSIRTDTMLLLTVDIEAGKAAMFSFPRNMCSAADGSCDAATRYPDWMKLPLSPEIMANPQAQQAFPNGTYSGIGAAGYNFLNSEWRYAAANPEIFPGSEGVNGADCQRQFDCARAWGALSGTIQQFAGVAIDGIIAVNLKGFVSLIENLPPQCPPSDLRVALTNADCYGGVWIDVPTAVHDDQYHTSQQDAIVVDIQKGCQFLDAEMTLAYSRARHETSDYDRARRQQYVLQQVRKQLDPLALLPHVPALLQVASENLFMTWQDDDIAWLAQAASRVDADRMYRFDFAPNKVASLGSMNGVRQKVNNIFSEPEPQPETKRGGDPCPPR